MSEQSRRTSTSSPWAKAEDAAEALRRMANDNVFEPEIIEAEAPKAVSVKSDAPTGWSWHICLSLTCVGILVYGFLYSTNSTTNLAYLFGYNLPLGLLIWVIFHAAIGRKHRKKSAGLSFLAIFVSLIGGGLIGYSQQKREAIQVLSEVQSYLSTINAPTDSQGLPKHIEERVDTTPKARGELGEMERHLKTCLNQAAAEQNEYLLELEAIGWGRILDPERVKQDKALIESTVILKQAKGIVKKHRAKVYVLREETRKEIGRLNVSESFKREMLGSFDKAMDKSKRQLDAHWDLEEKILTTFESIVAFLSARVGAWVVSEGQIHFYREEDTNRYNAFLASVQDAVRQQEAIRKQMAEAADDCLNKMLNALRK